MSTNPVLTPTDFVAITNQVLDTSFGLVYIEGEISSFRVSKNKWVYFDLKDNYSKVSCFGSVYSMPGPLEDGLVVQIAGSARLHPQFGFSVTVSSVTPVGKGSIAQAFALLQKKLEQEGLFDDSRKRTLPYPPKKIAVVASIESAGYIDFTKILQARWPYVALDVYDTLVQGESAPEQLVNAIKIANESSALADVLIVTRGGGSADDLAAFNDERVIRAIAGSRIPTLVAIGHEIDVSLSELVADKRASTPSNAAEMLVPDRADFSNRVSSYRQELSRLISAMIALQKSGNKAYRQRLNRESMAIINAEKDNIFKFRQLLSAYNPKNVLKRGYTITRSGDKVIMRSKQALVGGELSIEFYDGRLAVSPINKNKV
jgi:exodeoxyribonuclease VII large subunit